MPVSDDHTSVTLPKEQWIAENCPWTDDDDEVTQPPPPGWQGASWEAPPPSWAGATWTASQPSSSSYGGWDA